MAQSGASMSDGLSKMLGQLAQMATFPDADIEFLTKLQQAVTQYLRASSGQGPMDPNQGQPGQPQLPAGPPSNVPPPTAVPGAPGGMAGGGMMGMGMPNPDELRRMLGANANQGG